MPKSHLVQPSYNSAYGDARMRKNLSYNSMPIWMRKNLSYNSTYGTGNIRKNLSYNTVVKSNNAVQKTTSNDKHIFHSDGSVTAPNGKKHTRKSNYVRNLRLGIKEKPKAKIVRTLSDHFKNKKNSLTKSNNLHAA